jgi:hypothetical protein
VWLPFYYLFFLLSSTFQDQLVSNAEYHQRFYEAIQSRGSGNGEATAILLEFLVTYSPELLNDINLEDPNSASVVVDLIMTAYR